MTDPTARAPLAAVMPDGREVLIDPDAVPKLHVATRVCRPWEFGDERRGAVGQPCTTPECRRHLAIYPDPGRARGERRTDTLYICQAALAGYCPAMFGRPHPSEGAPA